MSIGVPFERQCKDMPVLGRLQRLYALGLGVLFLQFYLGAFTCVALVWSSMSQYLNDRSFTENPSRALPDWLPEAHSFIHWGIFVLVAALPVFGLAWLARPREGQRFLSLSLCASAPTAVLLLFVAAMVGTVRILAHITGVGTLSPLQGGVPPFSWQLGSGFQSALI